MLKCPHENTGKAALDGYYEQVARAIDPGAWAVTLPIPTRDETNAFYARRQASIRMAKAAIAAMQPHIEAQREDAARRALEAASAFALDREEWAVIRTIPTAQFRRPADADL